MSESSITKRALAASIKDLMNSQPLQKITVSDICGLCGMSRKGFYYHFKDKYDLVNWIFYTEFVVPLQDRHYSTAWDFLEDMCRYFFDNRIFYINAFQQEGQNSFTEYYSEIMRPLTETYLNRTFSANESHAFYASFFTDAFRLAIIRWLREDNQLSPGQFMQLLRGAAEGIAGRMQAEQDDRREN